MQTCAAIECAQSVRRLTPGTRNKARNMARMCAWRELGGIAEHGDGPGVVTQRRGRLNGRLHNRTWAGMGATVLQAHCRQFEMHHGIPHVQSPGASLYSCAAAAARTFYSLMRASAFKAVRKGVSNLAVDNYGDPW